MIPFKHVKMSAGKVTEASSEADRDHSIKVEASTLSVDTSNSSQ